MKETLKPGIHLRFDLDVSDGHTVPAVFPEADSFQVMPPVFATAYMVGFIELACIEAINPHLDDGEQSVGTHICVSHISATPVGSGIYALVTLEKVEGRRLFFTVEAHDEEGLIGEGTHERAIIDHQKFMSRITAKQATLSVQDNQSNS